jgi:predicted alpha/beta-hydrolase family hydrolase
MKMIPLIFAVLLGISTVTAAESPHVNTSRGTPISVIAEFPIGAGSFPAVVLAPGQGYHMALQAMEKTAKRLTENGVAVFRFNWTYFSAAPKGKPSNDLSLEIEDMSAVIAAAKADPRVRKDDVWAAGKSLGSLVAWRVLASDKSLRGGAFLTPLCSRVPDGKSAPISEAEENYPGLTLETRPLAFVLGDKDPLCAPPLLYSFLANASVKTRIGVVGGDHSFENKARTGASAAVALEENLRVAAEFITLAISDASAP